MLFESKQYKLNQELLQRRKVRDLMHSVFLSKDSHLAMSRKYFTVIVWNIGSEDRWRPYKSQQGDRVNCKTEK